MPDTNDKIYSKLNGIIVSLLVVQVITVSVSVAASSIAFGTWGGLWIIQLLVYRKEPHGKVIWQELKYIVLFMLLFSVAEILSRIYAVYPEGAMIGLKRLLLFLVFFGTVYKIPDRKALHFVLFVVLCSVMLVSIYELVNYFILAPTLIPERGFAETRIDYLLYPISSAEIKIMVLMTIFPLMFIKERFFVDRKYLIIISIPILLSMLLTQSRNVLLAFIVCLAIFGFIKNWKAVIVGAVVIIILLFVLPPEFTSRFTSIFDPEHGSNAARLTMWKTGWQIFLANPFTGVGDNKIMDVYIMYKPHLTEWEHSHLHSNIFMILATTGILGFVSFVGLFLTVFLKQLKYYREITNESDHALILGSILMFISFQISGIFEWNFGDHEVLTVFLFLLSVPFIIFKLTQKKQNKT